MVRFGYSIDVGKSIETDEKTGEKLSAERIQKEMEEASKQEDTKPSEEKPVEEKPSEAPDETPEKELSEKQPEELPEETPAEEPKKPEEPPKEEKTEENNNLEVKSISFDKAELLKDIQKPIEDQEGDVNEIIQESFETNNKELANNIKVSNPKKWGLIVLIVLLLGIGLFFMKPSEAPDPSPESGLISLSNVSIELPEVNITDIVLAVPNITETNITETMTTEENITEENKTSAVYIHADSSLENLAFALKD